MGVANLQTTRPGERERARRERERQRIIRDALSWRRRFRVHLMIVAGKQRLSQIKEGAPVATGTRP